MALRGMSNSPFMPTMISVASFYTVKKGSKLDASYTELFVEKTTEKLPQNGRDFSLLTLRAFPDMQFAGASPEEILKKWLAFEQDTVVTMKFGEADIWKGFLEDLLPYTRIPNDDGTYTKERKEQYGVLLWTPEGEQAFQEMVNTGSVDSSTLEKFARIGDMPTTKMVIDPEARFSIELAMPELDTDVAAVTFARKHVKADELFIRFVLDTDAFVHTKKSN